MPHLEAIRAECRQIAADQAAAAERMARAGTTGAMAAAAASAGRRGSGMPGSAHRFPGEYTGPAGGFATGHPLDTAPGGSVLMGLAEYAAGDDDAYRGVSDDELAGLISAWDRTEAAASARKHAAVAELIRRRPARGYRLRGPERMPLVFDEFAATELSYVLAENRWAADNMLDLAWDLEVKLPGTKAAFHSGILRESKVAIIARAARDLDAEEARAAEALVLGRAGRLTPGALRSAIARAVMEVAPDKARKRREKAAKDARVERWAEDSGNASLAGRELPPAEVLAADQRISWWAHELKKAGLTGGMDELRARAYLDILLGKDSRPPPEAEVPPTGGALPTGFVGRLHLTAPLVTLIDLAARPGEIPSIGPVDPDLTRDLAHAAARNPKTTWCLTVTDEQGHAIGHGCARPEPKSRARKAKSRPEPRSPAGHDPPGFTSPDPGFTFKPTGQEGPPGGYGSWRFTTGVPGQRDLIFTIDPIATDTCDHRFEAAGHNPGRKLRHLTQILHATCTGPTCRKPSIQADFEHNTPYEAGGRTCMCNGGPKCRHEHRIKQDRRWKVEQPTPATFVWTTPSGRQYTTEPTRYPI